MESGVGTGKGLKMAVIGSDLLSMGFKLSGVTQSFTVENDAQAEQTLRTLLGKDDIGIIAVTSKVVKSIKDRKLQTAITSSVMPLIVEIPEYGEEKFEEDTLRRLIIRAIGIDISKGKSI